MECLILYLLYFPTHLYIPKDFCDFIIFNYLLKKNVELFIYLSKSESTNVKISFPLFPYIYCTTLPTHRNPAYVIIWSIHPNHIVLLP